VPIALDDCRHHLPLAVCGVDEVGTINGEDQQRLQSGMKLLQAGRAEQAGKLITVTVTVTWFRL